MRLEACWCMRIPPCLGANHSSPQALQAMPAEMQMRPRVLCCMRTLPCCSLPQAQQVILHCMLSIAECSDIQHVHEVNGECWTHKSACILQKRSQGEVGWWAKGCMSCVKYFSHSLSASTGHQHMYGSLNPLLTHAEAMEGDHALRLTQENAAMPIDNGLRMKGPQVRPAEG